MKRILVGAACALISCSVGHAQLVVVTPSATSNNQLAQDLVNNIVGGGINIVGTPTMASGGLFSSGIYSASTFSGGTSTAPAGTYDPDGPFLPQPGVSYPETPVGLDFDSGIILSTGHAGDAVGPNISDGISTPLNTLVPASGGTATGDLVFENTTGGRKEGTNLRFSFTVNEAGTLKFNFIFASEEYNEWVDGGYNDGFELLLTGDPFPTTPINLARVPPGPGGDPVGVDTVNLEDNSSYYNDNDPNDPDNGNSIALTPFSIEYDGFTKSITATADLFANVTYTMDFVVYDRGDATRDSAVFIEQGSFISAGGGEIPEPATVGLVSLLGLAGYLGLKRRQIRN